MKREILFKAVRIDNGEWAFGFLAISKNKDVAIIFDEDIDVNIDPETVCQFTGLLDKNGMKIFEGDKIKYWGGVGMIVYKDATYYLMTKNEFGQESFIHITQSAGVHGEVIGNIHDKIEKT